MLFKKTQKIDQLLNLDLNLHCSSKSLNVTTDKLNTSLLVIDKLTVSETAF